MSVPNPLVVEFDVQAAGSNTLDFDIQDDGSTQAPFTISGSIIPVVQARTFIYTQNQASARWEIHHDLDKWPSVTIVDTAKTVIVGEVQYIDRNYIICTFSHPFSGTAYLN